ncbi:hypothetical protein LOS88_15990 [Aeromonas veronii]|nr:hypothetical protein [Aeromonas veronii]UOR17694.1 hypothetical protein LOS88_15990 [Aeromonas veronii]
MTTPFCGQLSGEYHLHTGVLAEQLLDAADTLLFLDLDWSVCRDSLLSRGSQSAKKGMQWQRKRTFNNCWCGHLNMGSEPVKVPANSITSCLIDSQTTSTISRLG